MEPIEVQARARLHAIDTAKLLYAALGKEFDIEREGCQKVIAVYEEEFIAISDAFVTMIDPKGDIWPTVNPRKPFEQPKVTGWFTQEFKFEKFDLTKPFTPPDR